MKSYFAIKAPRRSLPLFLGQIGPTTSDSIHNVVNDLQQQGIVLHEELAENRLDNIAGTAAEGRPATATTGSRAVRQHGGGLVKATQPRAALRSRQQCPSGGVKKSLCCAAAGINALALQAPATLAYPMTGVRQAQKLSTPLRSPIRPPAQLVVGYTHHLNTGTAAAQKAGKGATCRL